MNNNKFNSNSNSDQKKALESIKLVQGKQLNQGKLNDNLASTDRMITKEELELDNPNFVLGYN